MSKKTGLILAGLLLCASPVFAQQAVQTTPGEARSADASGTITVTNTFQTIWSATGLGGSPQRHGCLVVNTSANDQWVYFGADGDTPTKAKSVPLNKAAASGELGGWVSCATGAGGALQDHVWITGTSGDAYVAKQQ